MVIFVFKAAKRPSPSNRVGILVFKGCVPPSRQVVAGQVDKTGSKDGKENEDRLLQLAEQPVSKTCSAGNIGQ